MPKETVQSPDEEFSPEELEQLGGAPPQEDAPQEDDAEDIREDEAEDEAQDQEQPEKGKVKMVNHGALHKERSIRKQIQGERDALLTRSAEVEKRATLLEQRLNMLLERMSAPQEAPPQPEEIPDPEVDPVGHIKWQQRRLQELESKVKGREAQESEQSQVEQVLRQGSAMAMEFRAQDPDKYDSALQFVTTTRENQLRAMGMDAATIRQTVDSELRNGMMYALQRRINPGEFLMKFAEGSGFVYRKAQPPAKQIEELEQKVKSNRTLGNSPKHGPTGSLSAQDVLDMDDDEFAKWAETNGKKGFAKLFTS